MFVRSFAQQVTGVVGRAETLSSVFFLLAFIFYVKASLEKENKSKGEYNFNTVCVCAMAISTKVADILCPPSSSSSSLPPSFSPPHRFQV